MNQVLSKPIQIEVLKYIVIHKLKFQIRLPIYTDEHSNILMEVGDVRVQDIILSNLHQIEDKM